MRAKALCLSLILAAVLCVCGCGFSRAPRPPVESYTLEYAPSAPQNLAPVSAVIRVDDFAVDPAYNTPQMVYSDAAYSRNTDPYRKWRANPSGMVTYFLARDMSAAKLFAAALPLASSMEYTHALEGTVEEFYERDTKEGWFAVLSLSVTLVRANEPDVTKRVIFQKKYAQQKQAGQRNPQGVAEAMSRAMSEVSARILSDVYQALAKNAGQGDNAAQTEKSKKP